MKVFSTLALASAVAAQKTCSNSDFDLSVAMPCVSKVPEFLSPPADKGALEALLKKACTFPECQKFIATFATMTCSMAGVPVSSAAGVCSATTAAPVTTTGAPATTAAPGYPTTSTPGYPTTAIATTSIPTTTPCNTTKAPVTTGYPTTASPSNTTKAPVTTGYPTTKPTPAPSTPVTTKTNTTAPTPCITRPSTGKFEISVVGDATYMIDGPICSGAGLLPAGTNCPKKGDVAVKSCLANLPSSKDGKCIAPVDAVCQKIPSGAWGCVWNKGSNPVPTPAGSVPVPTPSGTVPAPTPSKTTPGNATAAPTTTVAATTTKPNATTAAPGYPTAAPATTSASTTAAPATTGAPATTPKGPNTGECTDDDFKSVAGFAACAKAGLDQSDKTPAGIAKACKIPECATYFKGFTVLKCTKGGLPASMAASLCA